MSVSRGGCFKLDPVDCRDAHPKMSSMHFHYYAAGIFNGGVLSNDAVPLIHVTTADGGKRKIQLQCGNLLGNPGNKGVAVGARKNTVGRFPRIGVCGLVDVINKIVNPGPHVRLKNLGLLTKPVSIRNILGNPHDRITAISTPANHIIHSVRRFTGFFYSDPGMNGKPTTPAPSPGTVNLDDSFFCDSRVGGYARRVTARCTPVLRGRAV